MHRDTHLMHTRNIFNCGTREHLRHLRAKVIVIFSCPPGQTSARTVDISVRLSVQHEVRLPDQQDLHLSDLHGLPQESFSSAAPLPTRE